MKLHTDRETINFLSVKHRLNPEVVEKIIDHSLQCIKECMVMEDMPNILIHNWGRFKPNKKALDVKFHKILSRIQKGNDDIDWEAIKHMLKVYDRIVEEDDLTPSIVVDKLKEIIKNRDE